MNLGLFIRSRLKIILAGLTIVTTLLIISVASAFFSLKDKMNQTLEQKQFLRPTEFFAEGPIFVPRRLINADTLSKRFEDLLYRARQADQVLLSGDYFRGDRAACEIRAGGALPEEIAGCFVFVRKDVPTDAINQETAWVFFDANGMILRVAKGSPQNETAQINLEPVRFAQYLGSEPLMQEQVPLGEIPSACLNAVMAIEDQKFLEHGGFSLTGILRAVVRNVMEGRKAQGGSTITQQLVKNYFLTSEKSFKRKLQEIVMSVMLETRFTKDEILQTYLNEIYLGQNGAFRVHGYGSASRYYFGKPASELNLSECALMAAIINNPGAYNPWRKAENAQKRRALVLSKMVELGMIDEPEAESSRQLPLPPKPGQALAVETAPYFIDAVHKQMRANNWPLEGARIYTSLDLDAQQAAQEAVQGHLSRLESSNKYIQSQKAKGRVLEGMLLSGDPGTGLIRVAVGGRSFRMTQFNRAVDSRRQVGSLMKPFVFLTALGEIRKDGTRFTPITLLNDEKFSLKYDAQTWNPANYEGKYFGEVPMFFALKNSLNAATAQVGLEVGLDKVITTAQQAGVESPLKPLPSLTLGAFEIAPKEVLGAAMTFASLGQRPRLSFIRRVDYGDGDTLYEHDPAPAPALDPVNTSVLVGMMKQTVISGSARAAPLLGFTHPAAGKTGTTNDNRDTWFMGFTPHVATVVWAGYDDNTVTKLTGASGSVPIWTEFMKKVATRFPADDFPWPEGTVKVTLDRSDLEALHALREKDPDTVELIFAEGTQP
ncbi:MAG: transglycosylase domain-containing protein [Bdellovibrionaceae bacterium]|nr:transglycosylase domain-containing protein [Pseudobdellovibrionaceae bacterium]